MVMKRMRETKERQGMNGIRQEHEHARWLLTESVDLPKTLGNLQVYDQSALAIETFPLEHFSGVWQTPSR